MRHRRGNKKLGKPTDQRLALLKSLLRSLVLYNRIVTTDTRAKEARRMAERLVTLGKEGGLHSRRMALKVMPDKNIVKDIFSVLAPKYETRKGGYTRMIKCGFRKGDAAPMTMLEWVE
ncbi:MAG: 50S ribosomal protein L17 [Flavobacteriales bacterium]|nr:50S ribosomal protein L17 [Flavobacteriales bacterium]